LLLQCYSNCQLKKTLGIVLPTFFRVLYFPAYGEQWKKKGAKFTLVDLNMICAGQLRKVSEALVRPLEPMSMAESRVHHLLHEPLHKREVPAELQAHGETIQKRVAASDHLHFLQVVRMEACMHCSAVTRSHELKPVVHVLLKQDKSRN